MKVLAITVIDDEHGNEKVQQSLQIIRQQTLEELKEPTSRDESGKLSEQMEMDDSSNIRNAGSIKRNRKLTMQLPEVEENNSLFSSNESENFEESKGGRLENIQIFSPEDENNQPSEKILYNQDVMGMGIYLSSQRNEINPSTLRSVKKYDSPQFKNWKFTLKQPEVDNKESSQTPNFKNEDSEDEKNEAEPSINLKSKTFFLFLRVK
jgi:hypothetical protein